MLSMIAAEVLGVEVDDVRFARVDFGFDAGRSGNLRLAGHVLHRQRRQAGRRGCAPAAGRDRRRSGWKSTRDDLVFRGREIINRRDDRQRISLKDVVRWGAFQTGQLVISHGTYAASDETDRFPHRPRQSLARLQPVGLRGRGGGRSGNRAREGGRLLGSRRQRLPAEPAGREGPGASARPSCRSVTRSSRT